MSIKKVEQMNNGYHLHRVHRKDAVFSHWCLCIEVMNQEIIYWRFKIQDTKCSIPKKGHTRKTKWNRSTISGNLYLHLQAC